MSNYPIVQVYEHPELGSRVRVEMSINGPIVHMQASKARLLATRLVEVVGCEQLTEALRDAGERNEGLVALLREQLIRARMCHICEQVPCKPDCRLRAALEGK